MHINEYIPVGVINHPHRMKLQDIPCYQIFDGTLLRSVEMVIY